MTYQYPPKEQEKMMRIAIGNCRYSQGKIAQLPDSDELQQAVESLENAISFIRSYAKATNITLNDHMPT